MRHRTARRSVTAAALVALAGTAGVALLPVPQAADANAATAVQETRSYSVDSVHSAVIFSASYMGMSPFYGQFTDYSGSMTYDGSSSESFKLDLTIPMSSIDTHNTQRDNHLKAPDWFNAREFPNVTFTSESLSQKNDGTYELQGELTLHGVTKPVTATVSDLKAASTPRGDRIGLGATFTVKRSDFGVTTMLGDEGIGDEITLHVGLQGVAGVSAGKDEG